MLRITILIMIILAMPGLFSPCAAEENRKVYVVQSARISPYDEAFDGFSAALGTGVVVRRTSLSELPQGNTEENVYKSSPDLLLAIGFDALARLEKIRNIPVVHAMVPDAGISSGKRPVTGVRMVVEPGKQLSILLQALPNIRRVGLLYDPENTGTFADRIRSAAREKGISLVATQVFRSRNVPPAVLGMKEDIDILWMLPDVTVITPEIVEFLLLFTMESRIPILTFSEKYVEMGALLSIGVDPFDMGQQAGEAALKILSGEDPASIPVEHARKAVVTINANIAGKLGILFDESIVKTARVIE